MRTRLPILLLCVLLLSGSFPVNSFVFAEEDLIHKNRNVTLIYDDSGSMWFTYENGDPSKELPSDNWKFANYSLQSLISLLGPEDELSVVRMSDSQSIDEIGISYSSRQREINRIPGWNDRKGTPFQTVLTSIDNMKKAVEQDPSSDFWFIIIMDGVFNDLDTSFEEDSAKLSRNYEIARQSLEDMADHMKQKEVKFKSILVTIESFLTEDEISQMEEFKGMFQETTGGIQLTADNESEIIDRINEVAALITNRDPNSTETESTFDLNPTFSNEGQEVTIQTPFPLRRLTVLHQTTGSQLEWEINKIDHNGEASQLTTDGPFYMKTPDDPNQLRGDIYGGVSHIAPKNPEGSLQAGEYTISFNKTLTPQEQDSFQFIAEPSLDFDIHIHKLESDGSWNNEPETFFYEAEMMMEVELFPSDRSQGKVSFNQMNPDQEIEVTAKIKEDTFTLNWNEERQSFTGPFIMPTEPTEAIVTTIVKGFYQDTKSMPLEGVEDRQLSLQTLTSDWSYPLDQLDTTTPIIVQPYVDEREMTEPELTELFDKIKVTTEQNVQYELRQNGNQIELYPRAYMIPAFTSTGEINFLVELQGRYEGEGAQIEVGASIQDIPFLDKYGKLLGISAFVLLFLYWLIGVIRKPRFDRHGAIINLQSIQKVNGMELPGRDTEYDFKTNLFFKYFYPYKAETKLIGNLTFKATRDKDKILLVKGCQSKDMRIGYTRLGEDAGKEDLILYEGDKITAETQVSKEIYHFTR
ncbi:hypothetical protein [Sutcliffiella horikoshii]|uniref:hypothetical protein n=1 Tax=Sutcliffiella horikoshii TaxID=79883 RepID=UPI003CF97171